MRIQHIPFFSISESRTKELNLKKKGSWSHWFPKKELNLKKKKINELLVGYVSNRLFLVRKCNQTQLHTS